MAKLQFFHDQMGIELGPFLRIMQALPENELNYRPHPESRSARELVGHLLAEIRTLECLMTAGQADFLGVLPITSLGEGVASFQQTYEAVMGQLSSLSVEAWEHENWALRLNAERTVEAPAFQIAWTLFKDMIHHRGQLSTYIRPMGGQMPSGSG